MRQYNLNRTGTASERTRICFLANDAYDWGGSSRSLYLLLKALDKKRFDPLVLFRKGGPLIEDLTNRGVRCRIWGPTREPRFPYLKYPFDVARCIAFYLAERPAIVHVNLSSYWRPGELLAANILGIPVVLHYRILVNPVPAANKATLIIANSKYTASQALPKHIPREVMYNIVDVKRFKSAKKVRGELEIAEDSIVVTFVGQIKESKGVDLFIEAAKELSAPNVKFIIAGECRSSSDTGDTYSEARLEREIDGCKDLLYVGYRSDVENLYKSSDIITMPSRWQEPFGLVNIEAGAAGKPVVSSAVGGIPEIITHHDNGLLFDPDDVDSYVQCLKRLIDDSALRGRIGRRAREVVEQRFVDQPVRYLESVYDRIAK